jgi:hypothetical protein
VWAVVNRGWAAKYFCCVVVFVTKNVTPESCVFLNVRVCGGLIKLTRRRCGGGGYTCAVYLCVYYICAYIFLKKNTSK